MTSNDSANDMARNQIATDTNVISIGTRRLWARGRYATVTSSMRLFYWDMSLPPRTVSSSPLELHPIVGQFL